MTEIEAAEMKSRGWRDDRLKRVKFYSLVRFKNKNLLSYIDV